ncbi:MAG: radical SAM protein [Spirochaetae bacterium HGW-Spirochaetae-5]|nr:MAG: radical SAM protein [Spirochaetae bacterium HGW-Spirochaetae-5]
MKSCSLCNFRCGIDRSVQTGRCGIDDKVYISHYGLHRGEEPFLTGGSGSGTIFFAGCTLRCRFCQNYQISRWRSADGTDGVEIADTDRLVEIFRELESMGASNINFVSPTPYVYRIIDAVLQVKSEGFKLPFVYNTHGYDAIETVDMLNGIIDIYLPDMKYGDDVTGKKFSGAPDLYTAGKGCIKKMYQQAGLLQINSEGAAVKGVAVRHLVIPGHIESSLQVLDFLESVDRRIHISLMSQYHPCEGNTDQEYPELNRTLRADEYERVVDYARNLGFKNLLIQEMESHISYLPDFGRDEVFGT